MWHLFCCGTSSRKGTPWEARTRTGGTHSGRLLSQTSSSPSCYPLSLPIVISVRKSLCNQDTDAARTRTIAFAEWLVDPSHMRANLIQQNMAPLYDAQPLALTARSRTLEHITCNPRNTGISLALLFGLGLSGLVVVLVLLTVVGWLMKTQARTTRKKKSLDNQAEQCAEAIAHFDLESVAWLAKV